MGTSKPFPMSDTATHVLMVELCPLLSQTSLHNLSGQLWSQAKPAKLSRSVDEHSGALSEKLSVRAKVFINV